MGEGFRQEHKFAISTRSRDLLQLKLRRILRTDEHAGPDGGYWIRSLYFDSRNYRAYRDKLDGVMDRSKFRIRIYNFDDSYIVLEKKERSGDRCRKLSEIISREMAEAMACGESSEGTSPLLREFDACRNSGMHPTMLVDYHRFPFYHPAENVRVTLDSNLRTPLYSCDLFNAALLTYPVFDEDEALLELKYDSQVPFFIARCLEGVPKVKVASSKYARCMSMLDE